MSRPQFATVVALALATATVVGTAGCSDSCEAGGGRCGGPAPVASALFADLNVSADGRTISGRFLCGGALHAKEQPTQVVLTYIASRVGRGGMMCGLTILSVQLAAPVGDRDVVDGVDGAGLTLVPLPPGETAPPWPATSG